jgi:hypothetical protein
VSFCGFHIMKTRLLTAAIALPILIVSIVLPWWFPDTVWIFVALAVMAIGAGLFEFYSLTKTLELKADAGIGYSRYRRARRIFHL